MSIKKASLTSVMEQRSCSIGGLGACPQQVKKGPAPCSERVFLRSVAPHSMLAYQKIEKKSKTDNKLKKDKKMKQNEKTKLTKLKLGLLIAMTAITTSCATNNPHKKVALKIIKNNNVILKEIQKERKEKTIAPYIKGSPKLSKAEGRLMSAINAVIKSNNSLKREFTKNNKKEVQVERIRRTEFYRR